jgi:benzoyl-CoA reductase/2-hydroxyglutaryl-CoA dehydratase subunit BcrC/BadD/HgdB
MNSKTVSIALLAIAVLSVSFAVFQHVKSDSLVKENIEWKTKYEEALVDMEEANKRIETMKEDLEKTLKESEAHRMKAEAALLELEQHKGKKR